MTGNYFLGDNVKISATFATADTGALFDPTSVICKVIDPQGNVTLPSVTRNSIGQYSAVILIGLDGHNAGKWFYRFEGSGTNNSKANEAMFIVAPSKFY